MFGNIKINRKQVALIILIFLLGFGVRAWQMKYELFFEFDSYFHAKMVSYILKDGSIPEKDPLSYYQDGGGHLATTKPMFWQICAWIYKVFTLNAPYDKNLWIFFVKLLPAIFGAIISVLMYFLGKEIFNSEKAGIATGFFAATVPAFVYRTMAGFFEEDAMGFIFLVLGLYFLVKAQKQERLGLKAGLYSILSGITFGIMSFVWGMFLLIPIVLAGYFVVGIIDKYIKAGKDSLTSFIGTFAISMAIFTIIAIIGNGNSWIDSIITYLMLPLPEGNFTTLFVFGGIMLALFAYIMFVSAKNIKESKLASYAPMIILYLVLMAVVASFMLIPDLRKGTSVIEWTVGEENTGKQFFGNKYNALIILPWTALLIIPYFIYKNRSKNSQFAIIAFFWIAVTLFMAWYKLKFTYTFGLPIALAGGFLVNLLVDISKKRSEFEKIVVSGIILFFMLNAVGASSFFVTQHPPNIETTPGWKEALNWLRENTPADSKIFNWWDEGHWISFIGERSVSVDNRNLSQVPSGDYAKMVLTEDENEAYNLVKKYKADYLIVSDDLLYKASSMIIYSEGIYDITKLNNQKFQEYFGASVDCSRNASNDKVVYNCGSLTYDEDSMDSMPTTWQEQPNSVLGIPTNKGTVPIRVNLYTNPQKNMLYVFSEKSNKTFLVKLWMNEPSLLEHFQPAYANPYVRIYKII